MNENSKKVVNVDEFDKKIEIEAQNLMYFNHLPKDKAFAKAKEYIESKYQVS